MSMSLGNLFQFGNDSSSNKNDMTTTNQSKKDVLSRESKKENMEMEDILMDDDKKGNTKKTKTQKHHEKEDDLLSDSEDETFESNDTIKMEVDGFDNQNSYLKNNAIPFWVTNPNILLDTRYMTEWFPIEGMSYNQKLNAISRLVILLTVISFVFLRAFRLLWIGGVCLLVIFLLHYSQTRSVGGGGGKQEGFFGNVANDKFRGIDPALHAIVNFSTNDPSKIGKKEYFDIPKINNPYNNVLVTDIVDNPDKLPAPPAYYPETEKAILDRTKEAIQKMNPTFPGIMKKLFSSFDDHFEFEQSMRQFHSNPSTTVPNDQGAFAEFCYGEMISCKEGNQFACARDSARYNLY
jgi:hypothetical protein